jgi:hypothetical protein
MLLTNRASSLHVPLLQAQTIGDLSISQALGLARDQFLKTLSASANNGGGRGNDGY